MRRLCHWHLELRSATTYARYLGFLVGPCAKEHAWEAPCRKLLERAKHIKTLGLSLNEAVLAFRVFAFSVIRFSLQLVPISPVLIWNFGLALDICTSSPRYSLGVSVLCSLRRGYYVSDCQCQ